MAGASSPQYPISRNGLPGGIIALILLLALLLPVAGYILLPLAGVGLFGQMFSLNRLILLFGGLMAGAVYLAYLRFVIPRPQLLVAFMLLVWPLLAFVNGHLLEAGVNIKLRPLLLAGIAGPCLWLSLANGRLLWKNVPWLKYYFFFFGWMLLYYFFFNAHAYDPRLGDSDDLLGEGAISLMQLIAFYYCLVGMAVAAVAALRVGNAQRLFDIFNKALILVVSLESLATIVCFPLGLLNMRLDGFVRAIGILSHPNPFAHHMGILMVYFLGLFCYYQNAGVRHRFPAWLLLSGLGINLVAFLLGLSKTAIATFLLCAGLLLLMNLAVPAVRRALFKILLAMAVLVPLGLWGYEILSGESFLYLLESRIDQGQSLDWRMQVWQVLIAGLQGPSLLFGHGFTAANATIYHLTFNAAKNAEPLIMVHNAYIGLLYDLGIWGYLMFVAALSLMFNAVKGWLYAATSEARIACSIMFAMVVYFLIVCGFDEMSYMFDAPMLFWMLATMLYCMAIRSQGEAV